MIDIENAYLEFDSYVSQFNPNEGRIKLKIDHIKRVALMSKKLAKHLKLTEEQARLVELIALFHDIGRFKQAQLYNTFNDKISMNHAELSVKVLFEDNVIEKFNVEEKYRDVIRFAILNHNKGKIEDTSNEEALLFAKIIRDADKLDIFYTICQYDFESIFWYSDFNCSSISHTIMDDFFIKHYITYSNVKTNADQIPTFYAYIYDFYFEFSMEYLKEKKYLEIFTNRIYEHFSNATIHQQVSQILEASNQFLENYSKKIST